MNEHNEYIITREIKSQTKVIGKIYAYDFMFLVMYAIIVFFFKSLVAENLLIPYYIFSAVMALSLTAPSSFNKQRRNYQTLLIYIRHSDAVYRPVKNISRKI